MSDKSAGLECLSWGGLWRVLVIVFMGAAIFITRDILLALLTAVILSAGLNPIVSALERRSVPRLAGTLGIFLSGTAIFAILIYTIVPVAVAQFTGLFG